MEIGDSYVKANEQAVKLGIMAYRAALEEGVDEGTAQGILGTSQRFWLNALMQQAAVEFMQMEALTKGAPQQ